MWFPAVAAKSVRLRRLRAALPAELHRTVVMTRFFEIVTIIPLLTHSVSGIDPKMGLTQKWMKFCLV